MLRPRSHRSGGFTLIELVVGIVLMALAMAFIGGVFFQNPSRSVEPLLQIRATEFGQALMDEILSKKFDENTPDGGVPACTACTASAELGPEDGGGGRADDDEDSRDVYDDVDDYNSYCDTSSPYQDLEDYSGAMPSGFESYEMSVCVVYDDDYNGSDDGAAGDAKLISIDIYPPPSSSPAISFRAYKGNY